MSISETIASRAQQDGFNIYVLRSSQAEVRVVPELGAKVISLKNIRTGREWMWHPGGEIKLFRNRLGDDFAGSTLAGWDECFPSIAACQWRDRAIADHGDVWSCPWGVDATAWARGILQTSVRLVNSPFQFTRHVELHGDALKLTYTLANLDSQAQEYLWAMHPLLRVESGDQLELTPEVRRHLKNEQWLDTLNFEPGSVGCAKVFAGPLKEGCAGVFNSKTGDRLTYEWNTVENDTLGVWLTRGGWNGHHHMALEPTNGCPDSLAVAAGEWKRCGRIDAHAQKQWIVRLRIES